MKSKLGQLVFLCFLFLSFLFANKLPSQVWFRCENFAPANAGYLCKGYAMYKRPPKRKFKKLIFQDVRAQKKFRGDNQGDRKTIIAVEKFRPDFP
jgi:hypothetical protein